MVPLIDIHFIAEMTLLEVGPGEDGKPKVSIALARGVTYQHPACKLAPVENN